MNARQKRGGNSIDHSLGTLRQLKPMPPTLAHAAADLQAAYDELRRQEATQDIARRSLGAHGKSLAITRRNLREKHLLPIVRRGKVLLKGWPGIREELRLPRVRASDAEWVAAARRIAKAMRPHKKVFLNAQFSPDFLQGLERAARELHATSRSENAQATQRALSTRAVAEGLRHCRDLVAAIDSLAVAADVDPRWLALWRKAKRIPKRVGRPPRKKTAPLT